MNEPQAFLNGRFLPASQLAVSVVDAGFVLGATVTEQLRTFGGRLYRLVDHLARLEHSLAIVGVDPGLTLPELAAAAQRLAAANHKLLDPADDLGLSIFVTPGIYPSYAASDDVGGPTVCMHTYPLPFRFWAEKYETGQALVTSSIGQVPAACWPRALKCRSRMHYYLADREAAAREAGARAVLLDESGYVTEGSTANVVVYRAGEGLLSPPPSMVLPGISLAVVEELAAELQIPFGTRALEVPDVACADEVLLSSTPLCLLPVARYDGQPIGDGKPGRLFGQLIEAWNRVVGLDIVGQARRFAVR